MLLRENPVFSQLLLLQIKDAVSSLMPMYVCSQTSIWFLTNNFNDTIKHECLQNAKLVGGFNRRKKYK